MDHYRNTRDGNLFDYLSADRTRLISQKLRHLPCGVSEIPLEFHLKPESVKKLSFSVPWGGVIYGFTRPRAEFEQKLGVRSRITGATVSDWDGQFVLIFETADETESAAFRVSASDVWLLLEGARRPNAD